MKTISLPLSKTGNLRWTTQHFGINDWKMRPMVIPDCARCLAMMIFWLPKNNQHRVHSITAVHIPPCRKKTIKLVREEFFQKLFGEMQHSVPYLVVVAGGKIDNPINRTFYNISINKLVKPFIRKFPGVQNGVHEPSKDTMFTNLILTKDANIMVFERKLE